MKVITETSENRVLKILLIDDNEENRFTIMAFLRDLPWVVDEVENGVEALEYFNNKTYDLILMDIQMPQMNGYNCTKSIRILEKEQGLLATPIIALTAYGLQNDVDKCLQIGCDGHLAKPIGKKALIRTIELYTQQKNEKLNTDLNGELEVLKERFLKNRPIELLKLREALKKNDFTTLEVIGHKLIGTAGSLDFKDLCSIGRSLEGNAKMRNFNKLSELLGQYELALQRHIS